MSDTEINEPTSYNSTDFDKSNDGFNASESVESENENTNDHETNVRDFGMGNIPLTPFNMKEELEEGYFDSDGMYHWNKRSKIYDNWADSIDSISVDRTFVQNVCGSSNSVCDTVNACNRVDIYQSIISYLQPTETVNQALCRLGKNNRLTTAERWKRKKLGTFINSDDNRKIIDLTGLANELLTKTGDVDIYYNTKEDIFEKVQLLCQTNTLKGDENNPTSEITLPALDMFSDDFDVNEKSLLKEKSFLSNQ